MQYSQKVIDHFKNPHNQGSLDNADAVAQVGNPACGDVMKLYLKISDTPEGKIVEDVKFETLGCAAAIAVSSAYTDKIKGKKLDEALAFGKTDIVDDLGGLPETKIHCSMLALDAFKKALKNYEK